MPHNTVGSVNVASSQFCPGRILNVNEVRHSKLSQRKVACGLLAISNGNGRKCSYCVIFKTRPADVSQQRCSNQDILVSISL